MQLESYIKLEQAKAIHNNLKLVIIGMVGVTLVTTLMFWSEGLKLKLLLWIGAAALIIVLRLYIGKQFTPKSTNAEAARAWLRFSIFGSFFTGLHWAVVPLVFLTSEADLNTLFVSIIFAGHLSASMSSNSAYPPAYYALAIPTTCLFAGNFLFHGGGFHNAVAVMICLLFFLTSFMANNAATLFREARELNFRNMELMQQLQVQKEAAENATIAKNRFLAAASHDLRQPLHSTGLLLSALEQHITSVEGKELLKDIYLGNDALNHSFSSLLDVSKLDAGVVKANMQHISFGDLVAPLLRKYQIEAEQKGLAFESAGDDVAVYSDSVLLERILNNLISNAINYTASGAVQVCWKVLESKGVRVLIQDSGIGIEGNQLEDIFSEYYQVNNPERDRDKGFGLGLAIVKRLCEILSIELYVCSEVGSATVFAIYLQQGDAAKVEAKSESQATITTLTNTRILVIDDDISVRRSMVKLISSWGGEVLSAESEIEAVSSIVKAERVVDLIIADYRLRDDKTGVEAIHRIRDELNQDTPAIIVTGDTSPDRLKAITSAGFTVLHKPVSAALLRSAIQREL